MLLDPLIIESIHVHKATVTEIRSDALNPLVYLPFHLLGHHLTARLLPHKRVTYPAHLVFTLLQYIVEHYTAEFPSIAAMGPALVALALAMAPYIYYRAFKTTLRPKAQVWAALSLFFVSLGVFKGLELGFPKDTPEEQAIANLDRTHSLWHLLVHVVVLVIQVLVAFGVRWNPKADVVLVPPSPKHSTTRTTRLAEMPCSPHSPSKSHGLNNWSKPKAA
jgi:hypothetical protein